MYARSSQKLINHFWVLLSKRTTETDSFKMSGQRDPNVFTIFCGGNTWLMYNYYVAQLYPVLDNLAVLYLQMRLNSKQAFVCVSDSPILVQMELYDAWQRDAQVERVIFQ